MSATQAVDQQQSQMQDSMHACERDLQIWAVVMCRCRLHCLLHFPICLYTCGIQSWQRHLACWTVVESCCLLVPVLPPGPVREVNHVLTLWFNCANGITSNSSFDSLDLVRFKLTPACVDISDLVVDNEGSAEGLTRMVRTACSPLTPDPNCACCQPRLMLCARCTVGCSCG